MVSLKKIGSAIQFLRKRAGFTQKDLADRIGVSDKAVSKWERGLGLPDVSFLSKLSILLDTDTDSLLNGDIVNHQEYWNGLLIFKESDITANTLIYDKPLSSYLLSYFLLVGIKKINIQCGASDRSFFEKEYGTGSSIGIEIVYFSPYETVEFDKNCTNVMVLYGKSFIFGVDQTRFFQRAMTNLDNTVILSLPKESEDEKLRFDEEKKIVDEETALFTQYDYYRVPVAFMPKGKVRAFLDNEYSIHGNYYTEVLDRGFIEISIDSLDDVYDASQLVKIIQKNCEMHIYCIEEIAWRRGMITIRELRKIAETMNETEYGKYLLKICDKNE